MGQALLKNLIESDEKRLSQIVQMHKILKSKNWESARDFTRAVVQENSQLANVIRDILHGWYRGIVNNKVIVYQSAMMFTLTKNVLYPKTYANGEVFYWASKPPTILPTQTQPVMAPSIPKDLGQ
ncbi:hypothetical protein ZMO02_07130 [Zymomonas mobilis subsp. pomaceae]|nr:hypothetical protein ZMO02_07130 [Zymomonas mobilis subsp. pomaceae]